MFVADPDPAWSNRPGTAIVTAMERTSYRRIFITGAAGFVGRALAERYRALGAEVVGMDAAGSGSAGIVAGDIRSPGPWTDHLRGADLVVHTAAIVSNNIEPVRAWEVNVLGTQRVLEAAREAGARRFVSLSSIAALGFLSVHLDRAARLRPGPIDERFPVMPYGNPYTDTKIAAEHTVLAAHAAGEIACTLIRPSDVYGPGSRPWVIEPLALARAGQLVLPARGRGTFTPLYIDDLVEGILRAAESPATAGLIVQLGGEQGVSTAEYFGHLTAMLGKPAPPATWTPVALALARVAAGIARVRRQPTELGRGAIEMLTRDYVVDNSRARELLDWTPRVGLAEGMARTEAWARSAGLLDA